MGLLYSQLWCWDMGICSPWGTEHGDPSAGAEAVINNRKRSCQEGQKGERDPQRKEAVRSSHFHFCCTHALLGWGCSAGFLQICLAWGRQRAAHKKHTEPLQPHGNSRREKSKAGAVKNSQRPVVRDAASQADADFGSPWGFSF